MDNRIQQNAAYEDMSIESKVNYACAVASEAQALCKAAEQAVTAANSIVCQHQSIIDVRTGAPGAVFSPRVASDGTLSWTNDKNLPTPPSVNIRGVKGDKGDVGVKGDRGDKGDKGEVGRGLNIKGAVASIQNLPSNALQGDMYFVGTNTPKNIYQYNGSAWNNEGMLQGDRGYNYTPSVSAAGVLTWTNNGGLANPEAVVVKGATGAVGSPGAVGATPNITMSAVTASGSSPSIIKSGTTTNPHFTINVPKGERGIDAVPNTLSIGTVTTGESIASASITGVAPNQTLNLTIPKMIMPIGAIYLSAGTESPTPIFGGIWEQLLDDAYLKISTNVIGRVGGTSSNHVIPIASMPSHNHTAEFSHTQIPDNMGIPASGAKPFPNNNCIRTTYSGGDQPYYPYYYGIKAWKRIS